MVSPTRSVVHQQRHAVAAGAGADERPVGHLGPPVVRASGAEERGAGAGDRDDRPGGCRRRLRCQPVGEPRPEPIAQAGEHGVGIEAAPRLHQRATVLVGLAEHQRLAGSAVEGVLDEPLQRRVLLLDDDDLVETAGERAHDVRVERHGHAQLEHPDPGIGDRLLGVEAEPAQRIEQLVVGEPGGHQADPGVARIDRDPVQPVGRPVAPRQRQADLAELALDLEHARAEEVRRGATRPRHPVDVVRRDDRIGVQHGQCHGAEAVGDRGDDLHRRPQSRRRGSSPPRGGRARGTPRWSRDTGSACADRRAWRPTTTASSTSCTPGRHRRAPTPRPWGWRRRTHRGAGRRPLGRARAPCRTRRRRRPRTGRRAGPAPAAIPSPPSRRAPRSPPAGGRSAGPARGRGRAPPPDRTRRVVSRGSRRGTPPCSTPPAGHGGAAR